MPANNLTVIPTYSIHRHTVTFNFGNGSDPSTVEQDYGSAISVPNDPVRTGYTFTGWDADIPGTLPDENLVFNAVWQINRHTVTFLDGYGGTICTSTQDYGSQIVVPDDPSRTGHTFTGWDSVPPGTLPDSDVTIAATWSINSYTITFNSAGGSPVSQMTAPYGSELECPPDPFLTGFSFRGWNVPFPETMPAEDLTLTATWRINQYTITFDTVGGTEIDGITANYGSPVSPPDDPVRTGYRFVGWNSDIPSNMPARDLTITARWSINQYTISFNTAGGSEIASITQDYDTAVSMDSIPVRTGYTFSRWNPAIPERMPAENTVVTASWTVNRYTISFLNTGDSVIQDITADYGSSVTAPGDPVRTGYTFTGWSAQVPSTMPAADTVLTAKWSVNQYTISFNSAGGSAVASIVQDYGSDIVTPPDPTRTGYTFTGWSSQIPVKMPATDMTITAQWSINQYTIAFDTAGGSEIGPLRGNYASPVPEVPVPLRTGHTFTGWSRSIPATFPAEDLTLTASWSVNKYTITFDSAGGSQVSALRQDYDSDIIPPSDPTRIGYTFTRWSSEIPAKMPASDLTITAQWSINQYTITFNTDGGSEIRPCTGDYGSEVPEVSVPVRTGYTFRGWSQPIPGTFPAEDLTLTASWSVNQYTIVFDSAGGSQVSAVKQDYGSVILPPSDPVRTGYTFVRWSSQIPDRMPASDMTITAQWSINQYTVRFLNTGDSTIPSVTADYGSEIEVPQAPVRTGYKFVRWDSEIPAKMPAFDTDISAVWRINQYTITFDTRGGTSVGSITADYGSAVRPVNDPTRIGHSFEGWNVPVPQTMPASDITITAQWRINQYTITFDSAGGSEIRSCTGDYGSAVPPVSVPVRTGYTFTGWSQSIPDTFPAEDLTLTASWSVNQYTIVFDTAGGSAVDSIRRDYGSAIVPPSDPIRTGYTFTGWSSDIPTEMPASDMNITAQWRINRYTISFDTAGGSDISPITGDYGSAVPEVAIPVREGHTFRGWSQPIPDTIPAGDLGLTAAWAVNRYTISFDTAGGSSVQDITQDYGSLVAAPPQPVRDGHTFAGWSQSIPETMPATDMRITARWSVNQYTISFDSTGGSAVSPIRLDYGSSVTPPAAPERTGYRFMGWNPGIPSAVPSHDVSVTAVWQINRYTISFDTAGGTAILPVTQDYDSPVTAPNDPRREGYTFAGWSERIPERMPAGNLTITAAWSVNKYSISFDSAGGSAVRAVRADYGSAVTVPSPPVREGYTFTGWSDSVPKTMPSHDVSLTALWRINQYSISFDSAGGSAVSRIVQDYGSPVTLPAEPKLTGHTFMGWNPSVPESMPSSDTTVTAVWKVNRYTISFDSAGGESVPSITENYGTGITPPSNPVREGYTFRSWSSEIPASMPAYDLRLTASWTVNRYTISFDTDGGSGIRERAYEYGSPTVRPDDPVRTGYTFTGWNTGFPDTMPASDVVLKAEWRINVHRLVFADRGTEHVQMVDYMGKVIVPALENRGHTLSWDSPIAETMPDTDLVYNAIWTPDIHTVRFFDGTSQITSATLPYGSHIDYPTMTRIGYTAVWDRVLETVPDEDVTVTASWNVNVHLLKVINHNITAETMRDYGSRLYAPDPGERAGFYFAGWSVPFPETMPDSDLEIHAVWKPTIKSGTGKEAGTFLAMSGSTVAVAVEDLSGFDRPTFAVDGSWSVSIDSRNFGSEGNASVSMSRLSYNPMGGITEGASFVYELRVRDGQRDVQRTQGDMTVSVPFEVPEGKDAIVWVLTGGDPSEAESEYSEGTLTFSTNYATYWAAGYVDEEPDGFPLPYVVGIAGIGMAGAAAAVVCIMRRIRTI